MLYLASDHAGFTLKERIKEYLDFLEIAYEDLGTDSQEPVDYTDYAQKLAKKISKNNDRGLLFCGTGSGMCMAANRKKGIRAIVGNNEHEVLLGRAHNDANVLCLSARDERGTVSDIIDAFCNTAFEGGRHSGRLEKIREMER